MIARGVARGKVALVDGAILVEEAVISGNEEVVEIGVVQLFDQANQILQGFFHRLEHPLLGLPLVTGGVDPVVEDVEYVMIPHQCPAIVALHGHQRLGLAGGRAHPRGLAEDLGPVGKPL